MSNDANPYSAPAIIDPSEAPIGKRPLNQGALLATALGLSVYYWGIILLVVAVITMFGVMLFPPIVFFSLLGVTVGAVMLVVGLAMCIAAPRETKARGLVIASLLLQLINFGEGVVGQFMPNLPSFVSLIANGLGLVGNILFLMFLKRIALYIGRQDLAKSSTVLIVMLLLLIPLAIVTGVIAASLGDASLFVFGALGLFALITFVMYVNLINNTRHAIRKAVKEPKQIKPITE